jgi:hypothetical protein
MVLKVSGASRIYRRGHNGNNFFILHPFILNMYRYSKIAARLLPLILVALSACAHIVKPNGGPKDSDGPQIIGAIPPPRVLNYHGDEVVIYFDEFIKPGAYGKEVFISPVQPIDPTVIVKNKHITVRFNAPLRDSTTYVLNFGTGIKDFNEGNKMDKPFTYAFSTGDKLDTMSISGKVIFPWEGNGEAEMKVLAFLADEIEDNDIFGKRPFYATETDKEGNFIIEYLREAPYKVYAVRDADNDYSYSSKRERIAITAEPRVDLSDSVDQKRQLVLYSYTEDKEAPTVKNVRWSNDFTVHAEFSEEIRPRFDSLGLKVVVIDSASGDEKPVLLYRFPYKSTKEIILQSPFPRDRTLNVRFQYLMDTLGTYTDTTLILPQEQFSKVDKGRFFDAPIVENGTNGMQVHALFPLPTSVDSNQVFITDSTGEKLPIEVLTDGYILRIYPDTSLLEPSIPYTLHLDSTISLPNGGIMDTTLKFTFAFTNPANFGSISGEIMVDTINPGTQYVLLLIQQQQKKSASNVQRVMGPGKFSFENLLPGKYFIRLIKDDDRNGYLSPGSLNPYFLPEKVIVDPKTVEIKANWAVEGYNVFPYDAPKKSAKLDRAGGLDGPGDGEPPVNPDGKQQDDDDED